jgi:hypothetical protein
VVEEEKRVPLAELEVMELVLMFNIFREVAVAQDVQVDGKTLDVDKTLEIIVPEDSNVTVGVTVGGNRMGTRDIITANTPMLFLVVQEVLEVMVDLEEDIIIFQVPYLVLRALVVVLVKVVLREDHMKLHLELV